MRPKIKHTSVFVIGFPGSGKSSVGKKLASMLRLTFFDTDTLVERKTGKTISRIFTEDGERVFRAVERKVVEDLLEKNTKGMVVALGGGAFENSRIRRLAQMNGLTVYLSCSQRELHRRLKGTADRPLLSTQKSSAHSQSDTLRGRIKLLMAQRIANYRRAAVTVSTTGKSVGEVAAAIKQKLVN